MKTSVKIAIPLLLVCVMLLTALSVFIITAAAQGSARADASAKLETYVGGSLKSSEAGTFSTLAAKLSSLAPTEATKYVLTLEGDTSVSAPVSVAGNDKTEVEINLGGFTLSATGDYAIKVSGAGATVRVTGGKLVASKAAIYAADATDVYFNGTDVTAGTELVDGDTNLSPDDAFNANVYVHDSKIAVPSGVLYKNCVTMYLYPGTTTINVGTHELQAGLQYKSGCTAEKNPLGYYELKVAGHTIRMPKVFANGMMLQRNKPVNVYGYCLASGAQIVVNLAGVTKTVAVGTEALGAETFGPSYAGETYYEWKATFTPDELKAAGVLNSKNAAFGLTITIDQLDAEGNEVNAGTDITIKNVNVGEIWVMSGQSNASLMTGHMEDLKEMQALAGTIKIRTFTSTGTAKFPDPVGNGVWKEVTASTLAKTSTSDAGVSAILYPMACKLAAELGPDVPVGAVTVAQGSSKIIIWMDYEQLELRNPTFAKYYKDYVNEGIIPEGFGSKPYAERYGGTLLYNKHIYSLEGYTTAGVLWYQGCGDLTQTYLGYGPDGKPVTYADYFESLEHIYRRAFSNGSDDLPFYVMQLAPYSRSDQDGNKYLNLVNFKYQQYDFCSDLPNTYIVSLGVDGMAFTKQDTAGGAFIHPARKSPVGLRTADMILANEYGIKVADVVSYPVPLSAVKGADGSVTITFDTDLTVFYGDEVLGFQLGSGSTWADATAVIDGNKLILTAKNLSNPTAVRYGCGQMLVELRDGTVIVMDGDNTMESITGGYRLTDAVTGKTYDVMLDTTDVIRSMTYGNLTNASGIPMPLFQMEVTAE